MDDMDNPLGRAMTEFNERVAKPWAEAMAARFEQFNAAVARTQAETRAKPCPCGCGHTLGEVLGDGIINPHMIFRAPLA